MKLFQPILAIAQQEMYYLILAIIKAKAVPCGMLMLVTRIKILVRVSSQVAKSFNFILYRVAVHNIHNHGNAVTVSLIYQGLKLLRSAETA